MDKDIIEGLESIPNLEPFVLYYDIKHVIEDKEIDDEIILNSIKDINKKRGYSESYRLLYDELTLFLEKTCVRRESINRGLINMVRSGKLSRYSSDWPFPEEKDTPENPIVPIYEGKQYPIVHIYRENRQSF